MRAANQMFSGIDMALRDLSGKLAALPVHRLLGGAHRKAVGYFYFLQGGGEGFLWAYFLCGLVTVAQFSYFGEYLPKVFPLHLRGTGGSFATNIGGRMIGTSMATLNTSWLAPLLAGGAQAVRPVHVALAAGYIGTAMVVIAFLVGFLLPEPKVESSDKP